jgi:hypothetical protein
MRCKVCHVFVFFPKASLPQPALTLQTCSICELPTCRTCTTLAFGYAVCADCTRNGFCAPTPNANAHPAAGPFLLPSPRTSPLTLVLDFDETLCRTSFDVATSVRNSRASQSTARCLKSPSTGKTSPSPYGRTQPTSCAP